MKRMSYVAVPAVALALSLSACSGKSTGAGEDTGADGVKTGAGVSKDKITLGALVPLSGPIGGLGQDGVAGAKLWFDQVNAEGGICGRQVEIKAADNKYNTQESVTQYAALRKDIAAIVNISPGTDAVALKERLAQDKLAVQVGAYDPAVFSVPQAIMPGTPYDVEAINGIAYLVKSGALAKGDTLGVIHYPVGLGSHVLNGAKAAADKFGLKLVEATIESTNPDATAQVNTMKRSGAQVVLMGTSAPQVVSAASVAESLTWDVKILAPNFLSAGDLKGAAGSAIVKHVTLYGNGAPINEDAPESADLRAAWEKATPGRPISSAASAGWVMGRIMNQALDQACEDKDLTPEGIKNAYAVVGTVDTGDLQVPLDYSGAGDAPSTDSFILRPDQKAAAGSVIIEEPSSSKEAVEYATEMGYLK